MNRTILTLTLTAFLAFPAGAAPDAGWPSASNTRDYTPEELETNLVIAEEVLTLSADGSILYQVGQTGLSSGVGTASRFASRSGGRTSYFCVTHIREAGKGHGVRIDEYRKPPRDLGGCGEEPVSEETRWFTNFAPVLLEMGREGGRKTVLRLTPYIPRSNAAATPVDEMPIRMNGMLIRNRSEILAQGLGASGDTVTISAPEAGAITVGLRRFPGAQAIGTIEGNVLSFKLGGDDYRWVAEQPILPAGEWLAWVKHDPKPLDPKRTVIRSR